MSHAQAACRDILEGELEGIREAGTWKTERIITSKQAVTIRVQGKDSGILNFCSNNYLGLSVRKATFIYSSALVFASVFQ